MTPEERRELFLDITERFFSERGLSFSMEEVAREAASSKRTLYEVFPSKEALAAALIDRVSQRIDAGYVALMANSALTYPDRLRRILLEGASPRNQSLVRRLRELERAYPALFKRLSDWSAEGWDRIAAFILEGANEGHFKKVDPALLEILLAGFHRELATRGFQVGDGWSLEDTFSALSDLLLCGLRPRNEEPQAT